MPKKKVFVARNLKRLLPNLPLRPAKAKKKIKVFLSRQFCASLTHPTAEHESTNQKIQHTITQLGDDEEHSTYIRRRRGSSLPTKVVKNKIEADS
jgi:hypothetical protein